MDFEEDTEPSAAWREVMEELGDACDEWMSELDTMEEEFNRWLDAAFDEIEKQSSEETAFQKRGVRAEDVYREAQSCRQAFQSKLASFDLPIDVPLVLCQRLEERAQREPSEALTELYCSLLCDGGFLLLSDEAAARDEIHQPMALWYLSYPKEREKLLSELPKLRRLSGRFAVLLEQRCRPLPKDDGMTGRSDPLLISCIKALGSPEHNSVLRENMSFYMRVAEASPILKSVEPLFLFLLLTKHEKRMCKNMGLRIDMKALLKPKETIVNRNNGRNFTTYNQRLKKFQVLCQKFAGDQTVDFPLCWYSLDQLTSLGEFYRSGRSEQKNLPFPSSVEELVTHARFSCSAYRTNVFLGDSGISKAALDGFLGSTNPLVIRLMAGIADCLDRNCTAYLERFCRGDAEEVKRLCVEILTDVNVSAC